MVNISMKCKNCGVSDFVWFDDNQIECQTCKTIVVVYDEYEMTNDQINAREHGEIGCN